MGTGVEIATGDLTDAASLARAVSGIHTIIHLAARLHSPVQSPDELHEFNVGSTAAMAMVARSSSVQRFVHVSSGGVYGDGRTLEPHRESDTPTPGNAYERSKLAAEGALRDRLAGSSVAWVILRPAGIYGAGRPATAAFFDRVRGQRLWLHSTPNVIVHPTHVSDVVQACLRVLDASGIERRVFNVAGERSLPFHEFVAMTADALGVRARQLVIPSLVGRPLARAAAGGMRAVGMHVPERLDRVARAAVNRALDISLARRVLGFTPTDLPAALRESVEAMRAG